MIKNVHFNVDIYTPAKPVVLIENKPKNSCAHVMPTEIFSRGHDFYKNDDKLDYSDGDI